MLRFCFVAMAVVAPITLAAARDWPSARFRDAAPQAPPCTCRAPGAAVDVGEETCLATPTGARRARCVMVLNNTSWAVSTELCGSTAALTQ